MNCDVGLKESLQRYKCFLEWFCYDHGYQLDDIQYITREIEQGTQPMLSLSSYMLQQKKSRIVPKSSDKVVR